LPGLLEFLAQIINAVVAILVVGAAIVAIITSGSFGARATFALLSTFALSTTRLSGFS
jgi:hypothetical protein